MSNCSINHREKDREREREHCEHKWKVVPCCWVLNSHDEMLWVHHWFRRFPLEHKREKAELPWELLSKLYRTPDAIVSHLPSLPPVNQNIAYIQSESELVSNFSNCSMKVECITSLRLYTMSFHSRLNLKSLISNSPRRSGFKLLSYATNSSVI